MTGFSAYDPEAIATLYRAWYEPLWRFAVVLLRSPDLAEEVVQDVFLRLAARADAFDVQTEIRVYLYAAVRNRAHDLLRHQRTVTNVETLVQDDALDAPAIGRAPVPPDVIAEGTEFMEAYRHALSILTGRERQALLLRWEEEMTLAQVSDALGMSIEGARTIIARAQQKIRRALAQYRT